VEHFRTIKDADYSLPFEENEKNTFAQQYFYLASQSVMKITAEAKDSVEL